MVYFLFDLQILSKAAYLWVSYCWSTH